MDKILAQDSNSVLELLQKSRIVKFDIQVLISFSHLADELIVICKMCRIPRMARLCFCVFHEKKGRKTALTWVNMNIFDYQRKLRRMQTLHMWDANDQGTHDLLNPLKTSRPNFTFEVCNFTSSQLKQVDCSI